MKTPFFVKILLVVSFVMTSTIARAQGTETLTREDLQKFSNSNVIRVVSTTKYKGTPYLNPEWQRGHLIINRRAKTQELLLRYNAHENHVEYVENESAYAVPPDKLTGFVIYTTDGDIIFKNGFNSQKNDIDNHTLLRVIYDGKVKLLAHHKIILRDVMQAYGSATKQKEFVKIENYYLVDDSGSYHKMKKLKEKDILKRLGEKKNDLKEYARNRNLSFSKEKDLKILLQYYESL